jgi:hypothetical protein
MISGTWLTVGIMAASLFLPAASRAQGRTTTPSTNPLTQMDGVEQNRKLQEKDLRDNLGDPQQEEAYKAFHGAQDLDKKIKLGQAFINKYPSNWHARAVYDELAQACYSKQDLANFHMYADKGIALFPDDVTLLAMSGWVIPRAYQPDDPDAEKKLDKAENYAKHAIEVLATLQKPATMPDQQFQLYKTEESAIAHSALGLIYFRREQFQESAKEILEATQVAATPDPTDFFVLGADFQNLNRFKEAADAFNRCAQIGGALQQSCKESADRATMQAAQAR